MDFIVDLTQFYFEIFLKFDKNIEKKLKKAMDKASQTQNEPSTTQLKILLAEAFSQKILDPVSSNFIDAVTDNYKDMQFTFSHILKNLALYPLQGDHFKNWNRHVELFDLAERSHYSQKMVKQLHDFLLEFTSQKEDSPFFSLKEVQQPFHNILLLIVHLDTLISSSAHFEPLCFNHYFKYRLVKDKPYYPSRSFSDVLLFLLGSRFEKKFVQKIPDITKLTELIDAETLGEGMELNCLSESARQKKEQENENFTDGLRQQVKKMREGKKFCYLTDIDQFFTVPFNLQNIINHCLFEKTSLSNLNFLQTGQLTSIDELKFNDMNALWLIYFFQNYFYNYFVKHNPNGLVQLSSSLEFMTIWKTFNQSKTSEAIYQWPTELQKIAKPS